MRGRQFVCGRGVAEVLSVESMVYSQLGGPPFVIQSTAFVIRMPYSYDILIRILYIF